MAPLLSVTPARAGGPLGQNGEPIATSRYSIDFYQGPVSAGSRVVGLGGAYVAVAEDVDGNLQNPAAPAVRPFYSVDHFDWWPGFSISFPADIENLDFFNSGSRTAVGGDAEGLVFATPALNLQWGNFGVGATAELQNYGFSEVSVMTAGEEPATLDIVVSTLHLQTAYAFLDGQLVAGLGNRFLVQSVKTERSGGESVDLFSTSGAGLQAGLLLKPRSWPLRLGFAYRAAIDTAPSYSKQLLPDDNGDIAIAADAGVIYLPERVSAPWDVNLGAAVQFGRPLNPVWQTGDSLAEYAVLQHRLRELRREEARQRRLAAAQSEQERERIESELDREQERDDELLERAIENGRRLLRAGNAALPSLYLLLSASLLISGTATEAVGVDSFLTQVINRSGQDVVYSPRFGAESEVWPRLLKLRVGTYLEPTRFETSSPRLHATMGLDVRLVRWNVFGLWPRDYLWRIGLSGDVAERYVVWGLAIGGWYPRWAAAPF